MKVINQTYVHNDGKYQKILTEKSNLYKYCVVYIIHIKFLNVK